MFKSDKELYEFSRFSLDVSERLLRRDGKRVSVTDKAFDTLCILVRRGGELVAKDELMNEVWADSIVEENNLDQKISMLRQALGERNGKEKFIETVRGRGYRFLPEVRRVEVGPSRIEETPTSDIQTLSIAADLSQAGEDNVVAVEKRQRGEEIAEMAREIEQHVGRGPIDPVERNKWVAVMVVAALVVVAIAIFALLRLSDSRSQAASSPIDSIAVLPFENAAQDADAEYLSDGITESLINSLSQLSDLTVMSSSSVFRYKGAKQDVQKVGNELNVRAVLTGSVKQIGDQIVINVSLDDVRDGHRIWGDQYARKFADVLNVQSNIARAVSTNLRLRLTGADERRLAKHYTENSTAYQLYLKGNYEWNKHTREDIEKGIEYYDQALEIDPNYALAYTGLSACYGVLGDDSLPAWETFPKAEAYAAKALSIDDTLAEAHGAMGAVRLYYDRNWDEAEKELKNALSLDPNNAVAGNLYADYLDAMSRQDEAKVERERVQSLDPLSPMFATNLGATLYYGRRYDEAIQQIEKSINLEPRYAESYLYLGQAYEQRQMYAQAIETLQKGMSQAENHPKLLASLGHAYARAGKRDEALKTLDQLRELSKHRYVSPYWFAVLYAGLGDKDESFAWLDKAYEGHAVFLIWIKVEPIFDPLRDDPRFHDLVRRLGFRV